MLKYLSVDCSVQSPPPEVEEFASIREFLQINGPLAMESYLDSQELLLDPTSTDTFDQITFKIRSMMQKLDTSAIEMVQVRMQIAFDLKRLYDIYDDSSNTIQFLKEEFGLNKRTYQYYQSYNKFLVDYPLFQRIPVAFSNLRTKTNQIQLWFNTEECSSLSIIDPTSKAFWTIDQLYVTSQNPVPAVQSFAAAHDIVQIRPDVDDCSMCIDSYEGDVN
jgi:hypothetical protein